MCSLVCELLSALSDLLERLLLHLLLERQLPLDSLVHDMRRIVGLLLRLLAHGGVTRSSSQAPRQHLLTLDVSTRHPKPSSLRAIRLVPPPLTSPTLRRLRSIRPPWAALKSTAELIKIVHIDSARIETKRQRCLILGRRQSRVLNLLGVKGVLPKHFHIAEVVGLEVVHISVLRDTTDFLAIGIVLVIQIVGTRFQVLETLFDQT